MEKSISRWNLIVVIISVILFSVLLVTDSGLYDKISREDRLVENLTAVFLAVTGYLFLRSSVLSAREKTFQFRKLRTVLFVFAGLVFLLAAGEEISWGQRILNFDTPERLAQLNDQDEFNFHNIDKKFFDRAVDRVTIAFVFFGAVLVFLRKEKFLGIKAPDLAIISAFAITPFYHQYNQLVPDFYHLQYIPLIVLLIHAVAKKNRTNFIILAATISVTIALPVIHINFNQLFPAHNNSANEYRELLFSICTFFYSYIIMYTLKRNAEKRPER
jgi:hypothetical protein